MTWLIVVGAIVAVALAVHFGEERKSRAKRLARAARPASAGRVSYTRSVNEAWELDLEKMVAVVTRTDDKGATETTLHFRLVRNADGSFVLDSSTARAWTLPKAVAELLAQRRRSSIE